MGAQSPGEAAPWAPPQPHSGSGGEASLSPADLAHGRREHPTPGPRAASPGRPGGGARLGMRWEGGQVLSAGDQGRWRQRGAVTPPPGGHIPGPAGLRQAELLSHPRELGGMERILPFDSPARLPSPSRQPPQPLTTEVLASRQPGSWRWSMRGTGHSPARSAWFRGTVCSRPGWVGVFGCQEGPKGPSAKPHWFLGDRDPRVPCKAHLSLCDMVPLLAGDLMASAGAPTLARRGRPPLLSGLCQPGSLLPPSPGPRGACLSPQPPKRRPILALCPRLPALSPLPPPGRSPVALRAAWQQGSR